MKFHCLVAFTSRDIGEYIFVMKIWAENIAKYSRDRHRTWKVKRSVGDEISLKVSRIEGRSKGKFLQNLLIKVNW